MEILSSTNHFASVHMKAVRVKELHLNRIDPQNWIMEEKFKGIRVWRIQRPDQSVQLLTHGGEDITNNFPHLCLEQTVPHLSSQLDCELFDPNQEDEVVSGWANRDFIDPEVVEDCVLKAFDILHLNGVYLGKFPQLERKAILKKLRPFGSIHFVPFQPAFEHEFFYESIVSRGGEGIVLKNINQPYLEGSRRVDYWLKRKKRDPYDCVVLGFTQAKPGKFAGLIGAVIVGQYIQGELRPICNVSGMADVTRKDMTNNPQNYIGRACSVWAMEQDKNSKALIEPSWKCLRFDKPLEECRYEDEWLEEERMVEL